MAEKENAVILKITEEEKKKIEIENEKKNAKITEKITENNKSITLNKNAVKEFEKAGVKVKSYYSYNKNQSLYNTIIEIVKKNADIFTLVEQ